MAAFPGHRHHGGISRRHGQDPQSPRCGRERGVAPGGIPREVDSADGPHGGPGGRRGMECILRRRGFPGQESARPGTAPRSHGPEPVRAHRPCPAAEKEPAGGRGGGRSFLKKAGTIPALLICAATAQIPLYPQAHNPKVSRETIEKSALILMTDSDRDTLIVFGGLAVILFAGWLLGKRGFKSDPDNFINNAIRAQNQPPPHTHGSAEWEPGHAGLNSPTEIYQGVFFGKSSMPGEAHFCPQENHQGAPIFSTPENHVLLLAKTRAGKGTRVAIPTLLRQVVSSCICIDPKGENCVVTARPRYDPFPGQKFGHTVRMINPWGELRPQFEEMGRPVSTYNSLDLLAPDAPTV